MPVTAQQALLHHGTSLKHLECTHVSQVTWGNIPLTAWYMESQSTNWCRTSCMCYIWDTTINVKKIRGENIFAIIAGTIITPRKYSLRIVHCAILVTLNLAINLLWNFLTLRYCRQSLETIYQTPRDHLPHQSCHRPLQKLASRYTRWRLWKRWRRGAMVALTQRPVHEQASTLASFRAYNT